MTRRGAPMRCLACSGCLMLVLPLAWSQDLSSTSPRVFIKADSGDWQPVPADGSDGRLLLRLDPAQTRKGRALFLIRPPAGMDINDRAAPCITGLKVDGKPKRPAEDLSLGRGDWQPRRIAVGIEDAENAVAEGTVAFEVEGRRYVLGDPAVQRQAGTFALEVPDLDLGEHFVTFSAADTSPQQNRVCVTIRWERSIVGNYCLAEAGAQLSADSYFEGYPNLAPLQDGKTKLPGDHCLNDISWASAETPEPHWMEVDFGQPRRITRVILCWAYFGGAYHTARQFEVQVPDGDGWRTVWSTPPGGLEPRKFTTAQWGYAITRKIRVYQPAGGGPGIRPNLMWLAEIMAK